MEDFLHYLDAHHPSAVFSDQKVEQLVARIVKTVYWTMYISCQQKQDLAFMVYHYDFKRRQFDKDTVIRWQTLLQFPHETMNVPARWLKIKSLGASRGKEYFQVMYGATEGDKRFDLRVQRTHGSLQAYAHTEITKRLLEFRNLVASRISQGHKLKAEDLRLLSDKVVERLTAHDVEQLIPNYLPICLLTAQHQSLLISLLKQDTSKINADTLLLMYQFFSINKQAGWEHYHHWKSLNPFSWEYLCLKHGEAKARLIMWKATGNYSHSDIIQKRLVHINRCLGSFKLQLPHISAEARSTIAHSNISLEIMEKTTKTLISNGADNIESRLLECLFTKVKGKRRYQLLNCSQREIDASYTKNTTENYYIFFKDDLTVRTWLASLVGLPANHEILDQIMSSDVCDWCRSQIKQGSHKTHAIISNLKKIIASPDSRSVVERLKMVLTSTNRNEKVNARYSEEHLEKRRIKRSLQRTHFGNDLNTSIKYLTQCHNVADNEDTRKTLQDMMQSEKFRQLRSQFPHSRRLATLTAKILSHPDDRCVADRLWNAVHTKGSHKQRWLLNQQAYDAQQLARLTLADKFVVGKASKMSQEYFLPIFERLQVKYPNLQLFMGISGNREYWLRQTHGKFFKYDFAILPHKIIFEFHGSKWHPDPSRMTVEQWNNWQPIHGSNTAQELFDKDTLRKQVAQEHGFLYNVVWDTDPIDIAQERMIQILHEKGLII
jgi:hypothetical protein